MDNNSSTHVMLQRSEGRPKRRVIQRSEGRPKRRVIQRADLL